MELESLRQQLAPTVAATEAHELLTGLPEGPSDWRALATALALRHREAAYPAGWVLGISGGQGAGKSTLTALIVEAFQGAGLRAVCLGLDDFYLTRAERQALALSVHPLLKTRGVPGTHDVDLAVDVLDALRRGDTVEAPVFDKASDDRLAEPRTISGGADLIIFEGWCVGAGPQPGALLEAAGNALEEDEDADGRWRRAINDALAGPYAALFSRLDELLFLAVPGIEAVLRWRTEQEQQHPPAQRMNAEALSRFVAHYERLTRWMLATLPQTADIVGVLDETHALAALKRP
ncbi:MAG: kinase [Pseudomonadota bacterium]